MDSRDVRLRRLQPGALAKILGLTGSAMGLVFGLIMFAFSMLTMAGSGMGGWFSFNAGSVAMMFVSTLVLYPIMYGIGFYIAGAIFTWAFNAVGGVTLRVDQRPRTPSSWSPPRPTYEDPWWDESEAGSAADLPVSETRDPDPT